MSYMVFLYAIGAAITLGMIATLFRGRGRVKLQAVFREYNETKDASVIIRWAQQGNSRRRLLEAIEYLFKIEAYELAKTVYNAFPFDPYPDRHLRLYACRLFDITGDHEPACQLAHQLLASHPTDDGMLALYVEIHLNAGRFEDAKRLLTERMQQKYKGTSFKKLHARILAEDGEYDQALEIMEEVVKKDYMLHRNTIAPLDKRLIYEQYQASVKLMNQIQKDAGYEDELPVEEASE